MFNRVFDFVLSILAIMILFPVMCILAVLIKLDSSGPVFYRGLRTGMSGKPFRIFKYRTMVQNAEQLGGPSTALNDIRLTRVGKWLRKYKLDEIPQLFNVVAGHMSLVGPRPQVARYTDLYTGEEKIILSVKPGMTDFASLKFINLDQILGDDDVDEKYLHEIEPIKNQLRIEYVKMKSFATDLKIIMLTVARLLRIRMIWNTNN